MLETSFFELRMKNVVNVVDGKNLGHICDLVIEACSGKVLGIVVPAPKKWYSIFASKEDIFIPYHNICKIGVDTILVEITHRENKNFTLNSFDEASRCNNGCGKDKCNGGDKENCAPKNDKHKDKCCYNKPLCFNGGKSCRGSGEICFRASGDISHCKDKENLFCKKLH